MAQDLANAEFDIQSILPKLQSKSPDELRAVGQRMDADGVPMPTIPGFSNDQSALNVPGLQNAPVAAPPAQPMSGLEGAISATPPTAAPEAGGSPSNWEQFLSDPELMLKLGADLLAPRQAGTSDLGHAVSGLSSGVSRMAAKKKQREADKAAGVEAKSEQDLRTAQTGALTGEASAKADDRAIDQDFKLAKTELTRAQASAAGKKGKGDAKAIKNEAMIKALFTTRPDKYASVDEARVAWETFQQTKGRDPLFEAVLENIWTAPKADRNRLMNGLFDSLDTATLGEPAAGPTATARKEVESIPAAKWLSLEGVNAAERAQAEAVYGKDVVARKIAEAKGM